MTDWRWRRGNRDDVAYSIDILTAWEPPAGVAAWLQAGDVGWMLRLGWEHVAESLVIWTSLTSECGAIALHDGGNSWRFAMNPWRIHDRSLAISIADWADEVQGDGVLEIEGPWIPAVWRPIFAARGFEATADAWAQLWRPLGPQDNVDYPNVEITITDQAIADRVGVQKAAFTNSTFTVDKWHVMAEGPNFCREFDLLARDNDGLPVAAVTAWLPGPGKCGMLEPMGTHPDFRRQGHGRRIILAECAALFRAGASGVAVATPESNFAAVNLYRASGFRRIGLIAGMARGQ